MEKARARELLERYRDGRCSDAERRQVESWYLQMADTMSDAALTEADYARVDKNLRSRLPEMQQTKEKRLRSLLPYAAALAIVCLSTWWFITNRPAEGGLVMRGATEDILPGGNRAFLTLADGNTLELSETQPGIVIGNDGVSYTNGSTVVDDPSLATQIQTLTVPNGGTYQLTLPDGSKVWLNAASTLRYPGRFDDSERVVELDGEAYFSVSKIRNRQNGQTVPFKVLSAGQVVQVLGTEFNVLSYADEPEVKTTLVEGSVRVGTPVGNTSVVLLPGEQSSVSTQGVVKKAKVSLKKEIAWKSGVFYFEETTFAELMRQAGRWYDIEIRYINDVPQASFSGVMSRQVSLKTLIEFLGESTAKFTLKGKTLTIDSDMH
ncbi:iron dicitrate transporter FecR [Parapedobacter defluvii]|uniref:Iron dicitrate transporter FecR n=1 Tax=Parapedobacter defluvii TaxID=2045106 RepID=A0ABQ1L715_9SPHI|nr:FecR family protein [Parapedobacter defluvii]GGC17981.1 iron dicitrate transporter FecR [Parapedobacter defluvii]